MLRLLPPIAIPNGPGSLMASVVPSAVRDGRTFRSTLSSLVGGARVSMFGSGRAALCAWLGPLRRSDSDEVVVPAYTCWSVPAAAVRAGFKVRLVDVDPQTFDVDPDDVGRATSGVTRAVIVCHLLAPTANTERQAKSAREANSEVRVLEDSAQAWPARTGLAADAMLLSFGRGKPLALGGGGALISDGDLPPGRDGSAAAWGRAAGLAATWMLARPAWYRLPSSLPFLKIGVTEYDPGFDAEARFARWQARLGVRLTEQMERFQQRRSDNARRLIEAVDGLRGLDVPASARARAPLRLPVLARDRAERDRTIVRLNRLGVSSSAMYPGALTDIPPLAPHLVNPDDRFAGAWEIRDRLLTLPVYPTLTRKNLERVIAATRAACTARAA